MADILALSPADQAEALALFYRKKARDLKKAERLAAVESAWAAAAAPAPVDPAVLAPAPAGEIFVPEEVAEAPPALPADALLAALGIFPAPDAAVPAAEEEQVEDEAEIVAPVGVRERKILPTTVLSLPEGVAELVERVRNGEITQPVWGTARYVKDWRAGKRGDPARALASQIRQEIRNGHNTKRLIVEALGVPAKDVDAAVREMSKMGVILC